MSKILISILSDHIIPNYLYIKETEDSLPYPKIWDYMLTPIYSHCIKCIGSLR